MLFLLHYLSIFFADSFASGYLWASSWSDAHKTSVTCLFLVHHRRNWHVPYILHNVYNYLRFFLWEHSYKFSIKVILYCKTTYLWIHSRLQQALSWCSRLKLSVVNKAGRSATKLCCEDRTTWSSILSIHFVDVSVSLYRQSIWTLNTKKILLL